MICMHPYLIWNIGPPSWMLHRHRGGALVCIPKLSLFFRCIGSFMCWPLFSCKYNAYPGMSSTITALVAHQAWQCPQVWCCLIHHEELSLLNSSENYPLIDCVHHANTPSRLLIGHELAFGWNTIQVYVVTNLHGTAKSSRHGYHALQ